MSDFKAGVRAGAEAGAARFSHGTADAAGRAFAPTGGRRFAGALMAPLQLIVPVLLLLATFMAAFLYGGTHAGWPLIAPWLTVGEWLVPLSFLAIHITNRRYGAAYALAQIAGAWAFGLAALWAMRSDLSALVGWSLPDARILAGFGFALFLAQIVSVAVFDRTRGPVWWHAPLYASFWGGVIFCGAGFPAAFAGTAFDWVQPMLVYLGVMIAGSLVLLVPYWALRAIVPPMPGFGGY